MTNQKDMFIQLKLNAACFSNDVENVKKMLSSAMRQYCDIHNDDNIIFYTTAMCNHWEMLNFLLTDPMVLSLYKEDIFKNTSLYSHIQTCYIKNNKLLEFEIMLFHHSTCEEKEISLDLSEDILIL